mgnify:CR=1 FL=1
MIRLVGLLLGLAIVGAAAWVYDVKYDAERLSRRASELTRELEREREMIGTLRAEWAHLNQPQRLQTLADRHLRDMRPQPVAALALPHEVPERPIDLGVFIASIEREGGIRLAPLPTPAPRPAQSERPRVQTARPPAAPQPQVARAQTPPPRPAASVAPPRPAPSAPPRPAPADANAPPAGAPLSLLPPSLSR